MDENGIIKLHPFYKSIYRSLKGFNSITYILYFAVFVFKMFISYNFFCIFLLLFLAMQEEVLKLVLLALEDGSALSRKVLVMFVVQRLEPHFPQASKTSIGHVVQLLYRASCFKVNI